MRMVRSATYPLGIPAAFAHDDPHHLMQEASGPGGEAFSPERGGRREERDERQIGAITRQRKR